MNTKRIDEHSRWAENPMPGDTRGRKEPNYLIISLIVIGAWILAAINFI